MDRNRVKGKANEAMGGARQTAGNVTGNRGRQAGGATQRTQGKAQGGLAGLLDKLKGLFGRR